MLTSLPPSRWRPWTLVLTLVLGLGGSVAAGWLGHRAERQRRVQRLENETDLRLDRLKAGLQAQSFVLDALAAHFERHPPRTDAEYESYLRAASPMARYPGLRGINLGLVLEPRDVPRTEAAARVDTSLLPEGHPTFRLHPLLPPATSSPVYLVRFVHPMEGNTGALGFNSGSQPDQAESFLRMLPGEAVATGPVALAQDPNGPPAMILRRLLRNPESGRPWGYLNTVWQPSQALAALQDADDGLLLEWLDRGPATQAAPPRSFLRGQALPELAGDQVRTFTFGGRHLEVRLRPRSDAKGFGPIWWPGILGATLAVLTLLAAGRHWSIRSLATRIQADLARTERQLHMVLQHFPDLLILVNADLTYREVYTGQASLLARPRSELIGRHILDTLPQPLGDRIADITRQVLASGQPATLEYALEVQDGIAEFEARVARHEGSDGGPPLAVWSIRDITARKLMERTLRRREEEFRQFFQAAPSPLILTRIPDGEILQANTAAKELLGVPAHEDLVGPASAFFQDPAVGEALMQRIRHMGQLHGVEVSLRTRAGEPRQVVLASEVIQVEGSDVLISDLHNVTDQRKSEEALRQAQKLESLGLLAGGIAHDFNNLLAALQGNLDLALVTQDGPQREERIRGAATVVQRAADLTRQLLAYSGGAPRQSEPLNLGQLASDMADLLRVSVSRRIDLDLAVPLDLLPVDGDRAQLQQVILNLVTNAADAIGSAPGRIQIQAGVVELEDPEADPGVALPPGTFVWLSVSDTGAGMDPEILARIFDPFFTTKTQGRGLGLSAIQGILRSHHADLAIASAPGKGSTFTLYFPALPDGGPLDLAEATVPAATAFSGRALVVDDEPVLRETSALLLTELGFETAVAATGLEALTRVEDQPVDLVLLDLTMPAMDGTEVLERLRARLPELPVILMSGYAASSIPQLGQDPCLGFLAKPFTLEDLRAEVARRFARD